MTTRPTRRRTPRHIGKSQLHYFIGSLRIVLTHLDAQREQAFWDLIKFRCPELFAVIEADFNMDAILFDRLQGPLLRDRNGKPIGERASRQEVCNE